MMWHLLAALSVSLSWTPPTENEDGSPYTNPGGYRIYEDCGAGSFERVAEIADPAQTNITLDGYQSGQTCTWTSTAFNAEGVESVFSNTASKTFAGTGSPPCAPVLTLTWSESATGGSDMALTPVLTDNFNRADQALAASSDWSAINFYFGANNIGGNVLAAGPAGDAPAGDVVTASHDADQYAQAVLTESNQIYGTARFNSLAVRCTGNITGSGVDTLQCYSVNISGNYGLSVVKYDAGAVTTLYTGGTVAQNDEIRIEVTGTTTTQIDVYVNDVLEDSGSGFTAQDTTSPFTTGVPGVSVRSPYAWDDWESGDITAGGGGGGRVMGSISGSGGLAGAGGLAGPGGGLAGN